MSSRGIREGRASSRKKAATTRRTPRAPRCVSGSGQTRGRASCIIEHGFGQIQAASSKRNRAGRDAALDEASICKQMIGDALAPGGRSSISSFCFRSSRSSREESFCSRARALRKSARWSPAVSDALSCEISPLRTRVDGGWAAC